MPKVKALLTKMRCLEESSEFSDSDEPYVLVFAAQIKNVGGVVNIPSAQTVRYGPWEDVDEDELVATSMTLPNGQVIIPATNFWGLDGKAHDLDNLDDVIFIAGLMENDDGEPGGIRAGTHAQMFAAITSYANAGMSRSTMVSKLKTDMKDVLTGVITTGIPGNDDLVSVTEVRFPSDALTKVKNGPVVKTIELSDGDCKYRLRFELVKG